MRLLPCTPDPLSGLCRKTGRYFLSDGSNLIQTSNQGVLYTYSLTETPTDDGVRFTYALQRPQVYSYTASLAQFTDWTKPVTSGTSEPFPVFQCVELTLP